METGRGYLLASNGAQKEKIVIHLSLFAMNSAAVQDFLKKIFSTAFGCPRRGAVKKSLQILLQPILADATIGSPRRINY